MQHKSSGSSYLLSKSVSVSWDLREQVQRASRELHRVSQIQVPVSDFLTEAVNRFLPHAIEDYRANGSIFRLSDKLTNARVAIETVDKINELAHTVHDECGWMSSPREVLDRAWKYHGAEAIEVIAERVRAAREIELAALNRAHADRWNRKVTLPDVTVFAAPLANQPPRKTAQVQDMTGIVPVLTEILEILKQTKNEAPAPTGNAGRQRTGEGIVGNTIEARLDALQKIVDRVRADLKELTRSHQRTRNGEAVDIAGISGPARRDGASV